MNRLCWKIALVVLTLGIVLYCPPAILPGENDIIAPGEHPASVTAEFPAAEDADESSDILTITTYTGHPEGHLITFPDGTTMSIDCATGDITTKSHFHVDHCAACSSGNFGQYNRNNVVPGDVIYSDDDRDLTVTVVAANGVFIGQEPAGPYDCSSVYENDWSMALLVKYKRFDYLTAGDLTGGELGLGAALKERGIHVDILKVSHHGSSTSTSMRFILDILPEYAVIAGGGSKPTADTLSSLVFGGVRTIYYAYDYPLAVPEVYRANGNVAITTDGITYSFSGGNPYFYHGPFETDDAPTPTPTITPTCTPTWDPSVPTYTPTATPTLRPEGPWPMFRYDAAGTGQSYYFIGPQEGQLAWSYATNGYVKSNPVVGFDGRVYVGSNDNSLYTLTSAGVLIWSYQTGHDVLSAAALNPAGTVHIGSGDDSFYAITSSGSILWSYITGGDIRSSAVIDSDGKVYVGSDDNMIHTFSSDGRMEWSYETGDNASSSPAVGHDGNIYTGSEDNVLYTMSPVGSLIWSYSTRDNVESSPVIKPDGSICVGSDDGFLYAFSSTGALAWRYLTAAYADVHSSPVIDHSGNIYVGNILFYGLTPSGKCRWSYRTSSVHPSAAIGFDGNIYIGTLDKNMYVLTSTGCLTWSYLTGSAVRSSAAIGYEGYVYVGSSDGRVYAFKDPPTATPTSTPTSTPTPTVTPTPTNTPTMSPTLTPTITPIPVLAVLPGALVAGQAFSADLALTGDITQPFDFYFFVDTPAGPYTLYLDGRVKKGIVPLYRNVPKFSAPYYKTARPAVRIPAFMKGKTVIFYAVVMQAGKRPTMGMLSSLTQDTYGVIMSNKTSATINP